MTSPFGTLHLIAAPQVNRGAIGRQLPALRAALRGHGLEHAVVEVQGAPAARRATEDVIEAGGRYVVVAGDDPIVQGVLTGLVNAEGAPRRDGLILGLAWSGSAGDLARTFGLDRSPDVVAKHLSTDRTMAIDVGLVALTGLDGEPLTTVFANVAEVGWGAHQLRLRHRLRRLGGLGRLLAAWGAIRALERQETTVTAAHTEAHCPVAELVVANGQFMNQGMRIAPRALPDDGRFNVQVFTGRRSQVFMLTPQMFSGEHLPHPQIIEWQSPTVSLAPPKPLPVAADGLLLGVTPAAFRIAPQALRLKI